MNITITITQEQGEIIFQDNGTGMKKDQLQQITNMFFRASDQSDGSGLGKYSVKQAIERQNASIHVESPNEKGMHTIMIIPNNISHMLP